MIKKLILRRKSGFTLIELIVTIAVLGILVLISAPRILGYTEKAQLTRIQHDVKIMEQEMELVNLDKEVNIASWDDNKKDLGMLILKDELYEKEGFARSIEKSHLDKYYESQILGTGGDLYSLDEISQEASDISVSLGYKIIPSNYRTKINSKLKGTFYANPDGKVYYEHDKPLTTQKEENMPVACDAPSAESLGYTFEIINGKGTITKYDHREENIIIPSEFKVIVNGEETCEPVRIIGKAAFAYGELKEIYEVPAKEIIIPESVEKIEDYAFSGNAIGTIKIPGSVKRFGSEVFQGNSVGLPKITVIGEKGKFDIVGANYQYGTPKELGLTFDYQKGEIISYNGSSSSHIVVPKYVSQGGVNYPVKGIAKGAYQGKGLVTAILPEGLERIEDYAFSGNRLTGITIPNSVVHIGNYAFSFNEKSVQGWLRGTMKTVVMKEKEQFSKINKLGDILESQGGLKVNLLDGTLALLNNIFVNSDGNNVKFVEDEKPEEPPVENVGDFEWTKTANGITTAKESWRYVGKDDYVEIPHKLGGETVTSYSYMFAGTNVKKVKSTNTNVTDMSYMFYSSRTTGLDLRSLDTSKVTDMRNMFYSSRATELNLTSFDTSNVKDTSRMFYDSRATSLDLSSFNTSKVTDMTFMFYQSKATELDLSSFNISGTTNVSGMFYGSLTRVGYASTKEDSRILNNSPSIPSFLNFVLKDNVDFAYSKSAGASTAKESWRYVGKDDYVEIPHKLGGEAVTSYNYMFAGTNVKKVKSTNTNVTDMRYMFNNSKTAELDLRSLDTSNVTDMNNMFSYSKATELDLSSFNTSNVKNTSRMFYDSQATSLDLSSFNTSKVTDMNYMFYQSKATELDLSSFNISGTTNVSGMFYGSLTRVGYASTKEDSRILNSSPSIPSFLNFVLKDNVDFAYSKSAGASTSKESWRYVGKDEYVEIPHKLGGETVTSYSYMFAGTNVKKVKSASTNVTDMSYMFYSSRATELDLRSLDTSKVTDMRHMFYESSATELNLSSFNTSNVKNTSRMFYDSRATSLDLSSFNTSKVTDMNYMFYQSKATELDLSSFNISGTTNVSGMFYGSLTRVGYARTAAEAVILNKSYSKPSALVFQVK